MDLRLAETGDPANSFAGAETDILTDGTLDYPDDLLKELDCTVCSVHSRFAFGKQAQTERILRAMDNQARVKVAVSTAD